VKTIEALIILGIFTQPALAASKAAQVKAGNTFYAQGKYEDSLKKYNDALTKDSESDVINFNAGTAAYQLKDYAKSVEHLRKALLGDNKDLSQKVHYNLGNALYRFGMTKEKTDLAFTVQSLEEALSHYQKALDLKADDTDAKYNYDFVKKELERLKKELDKQSKTCPNPKKEETQDQQDQQNQQNQRNQESQQNQQQESKESQEQSGQDQEKSQGNKPEESKDRTPSPSPEDGQKTSSPNEPQEQKENSQQHNSASSQESQAKAGEQKQQPSFESTGASRGDIPQDMSQKEAEMFLDSYQQGQEPKGLLNFRRLEGKEKDVIKDW